MQSFLNGWALSVAAAIIFSAVISSLLPDTSIKKYVNAVLGIVVTMMILYPVISAVSKIDVRTEIENSLKSMQDTVRYEFDAADYKDYVQKVYIPE